MWHKKFYILGFLLSAAICLSLVTGHVNIFTLSSEMRTEMLWHFRLPRTLLALLSGWVLGMSGTALQSYFKNPLVDASILGVSALGSFGSIVAIVLGFHLTHYYVLPLFSIFASCMGFCLLFACIRRGWYGPRLILIGLSLSAFAGALCTLILNLVNSPYAFFEILFWLFGSYAEHSLGEITCILPFVIGGCLLFYKLGPDLDTLSFGDDVAMTMGTSITTTTTLLVFATVLSVGSSVALTGSIGFIGLITPHILRPMMGERPSRLLTPSGLLGASLSLLADTVVRLLPTNVEVKVGVVTALIGIPVFIHILFRRTHVSAD